MGDQRRWVYGAGTYPDLGGSILDAVFSLANCGKGYGRCSINGVMGVSFGAVACLVRALEGGKSPFCQLFCVSTFHFGASSACAPNACPDNVIESLPAGKVLEP